MGEHWEVIDCQGLFWQSALKVLSDSMRHPAEEAAKQDRQVPARGTVGNSPVLFLIHNPAPITTTTQPKPKRHPLFRATVGSLGSHAESGGGQVCQLGRPVAWLSGVAEDLIIHPASHSQDERGIPQKLLNVRHLGGVGGTGSGGIRGHGSLRAVGFFVDVENVRQQCSDCARAVNGPKEDPDPRRKCFTRKSFAKSDCNSEAAEVGL